MPSKCSEYAAIGVSMVGGCCGTTPEYIARLHETFSPLTPAQKIPIRRSCLCTPVRFVDVDRHHCGGGAHQPHRQKAAAAGPAGRRQRLPLRPGGGPGGGRCAGAGRQRGSARHRRGLPRWSSWSRDLQAVTDLPLQLDSSNPEALSRALRIYNGKPIVNSVNGEQSTLDTILPLCKKYGAARRRPGAGRAAASRQTAEGRFAIAQAHCRGRQRRWHPQRGHLH